MVKITVKILAGLIAGVVLYVMGCWGGRALDRYAEPKFGPYAGPKYYKYTNGVMTIWYPKGEK